MAWRPGFFDLSDRCEALSAAGDTVALGEDLHRPRRHPHFDSGALLSIGHGVKMIFGFDMIIDSDARTAPLRQDIGLRRQRLEQRCIQFLEQGASRAAELTHDPFVVETAQQIGNGRVDLIQTIPDPMTQPAQQPAFDDADAGLNLGLVPGPLGPGGEHGGAIMGCQLSIAAIDIAVVKARLDHRDFGVVRDQQAGGAAKIGKGEGMRIHPVWQTFRPARPGEGQAGGAHDGHENMRLADFTRQPVDLHRHRVPV